MARLADLPAAALAHANKQLTVISVEHDLNDGSFLLHVRDASLNGRLAKITADGTVLWHVASVFDQGTLGGNSRLAGRAYGISDLFSIFQV